MAGEKKISQLTAAVSINDADQVELAQSGSSLRTAWSLIKSTLKTYFDAIYPQLAHTHAGTTNGSKLAQANTHESPDTDAAVSSLHHTIGSTATTAAAGNHDHSSNKLTQANTHESPDTDSATSSLHHTIGTSATQAAAGNHTHTIYAPIAKTQATDITSSSATLTLDTSYGINYHLLTESTVLQVPDTSGWANGTTARLDLFVQVDAGGSYAMTFHANWKFDGGTAPTLTATASAIDHLVVTVTKTSGLTLAWVGLAGADIKVTA